MPDTRKRELSDKERAERRRADREYARQAVEQLRSSEGWRRWLRTRRHFHAYSFGNQLLIAMARPTATRVAGFHARLKLGYAVKRGERAIKVWAPCPPSRKQLDRWQHDGGDADRRPRTYFRRGCPGGCRSLGGGPPALSALVGSVWGGSSQDRRRRTAG
jgi:hypothetical protein